MERILCLPLGVIVGIKTDSVCICCVYIHMLMYVCTLGIIVGIKTDSVCLCCVCMCSYDVCIYFQRPKALGKCRVSLQPPVSASVSPLPCSPPTKLSANRDLVLLCPSLESLAPAPWSPFRKTPWPHHERESNKNCYKSWHTFNFSVNVLFQWKRQKILDIRLYQHK